MRIRLGIFWLLICHLASAQVIVEQTAIAVDSTLWNNANPIEITSHALDADTELLLAFTFGDASAYTPNVTVDWNTSETVAKQFETTPSGSTGDTWNATFCLDGPTITTATLSAKISAGVPDSGGLVLMALSGLNGADCTAVTELAEVVNNSAATTCAFGSSLGTSGSLGILVGTGFGADMSPAANDVTYTEHHDTETGGGSPTSSDQAIYLASGSLPQQPTVTWGVSDENACDFVEVTPAAASGVVPQLHHHQEQMRAN